MMEQKILLVGDPRICPQVAYVMDWQDYAMVERLDDVSMYRDYKIVVCTFKRKSKHLVKVKDKTLDLIYLDDICQKLDDEERQMVSLPNPLMDKPIPLMRRIIDRVKHGEVGLAIIRKLKRHIISRNYRIIKRLPIEILHLSEMLIKVLYSRPTNIVCDSLLTHATIDWNKNLNGCCPGWTPAFGNLLGTDFSTVYDSCRARIIKLSTLNHSYCFCNLHNCQANHHGLMPAVTLPVLQTPASPQHLILSFDRSCNLQCIMCRADHYTADAATRNTLNDFVETLLTTEWLQKIPYVTLAGDGEVFYSSTYLRMLKNLNRRQICILSNGTLFDGNQWEKIKARYDQIDVIISVDAATAATYQKIRGGNFTKLMENLTMLGKLRYQCAIGNFKLHFVVQKINYREMADFVSLAKRLHVDEIVFIRLNKWGSFNKRKYWQQSLLLKNGCLNREFYNFLQNPIFQDPIVNLTAFQPYMVASAKRYDKKCQ